MHLLMCFWSPKALTDPGGRAHPPPPPNGRGPMNLVMPKTLFFLDFLLIFIEIWPKHTKTNDFYFNLQHFQWLSTPPRLTKSTPPKVKSWTRHWNGPCFSSTTSTLQSGWWSSANLDHKRCIKIVLLVCIKSYIIIAVLVKTFSR